MCFAHWTRLAKRFSCQGVCVCVFAHMHVHEAQGTMTPNILHSIKAGKGQLGHKSK